MVARSSERRYSLNELSHPEHLGVNRNFLAWLVVEHGIPHLPGDRGSKALGAEGVERLRLAVAEHERKRRSPVYG